MSELLIMIGTIIIGLAGVYSLGYLAVKITSYYKDRFGITMGPSIVFMCLSADLFAIAFVLFEHDAQINVIIFFACIAVIMIVFVLYRNIKNYKQMSILAIIFQFAIAVVQFLIVLLVIVIMLFRMFVKKQRNQVSEVASWIKLIWNM